MLRQLPRVVAALTVVMFSACEPVPASYEYTVRMGDGSSHVLREEMQVSWRVGERLIFIEGSGPLK